MGFVEYWVEVALLDNRTFTKLTLLLTKILGNIDWYEERLELSDRTHLDELPPVKNVRDKTYDILERDVYEQLCRGEYTRNESMDSRAYCYYKRDRPFLK